jgi:hypothetical protein
MLNERAYRVHAPIHGVEPQSVVSAGIVSYRLETPVLDHVHKGFGEVGRHFICLFREAGFMGQIEGIRLFGLVRQVEDQTEVGVIIRPIFPFCWGLRVEG